ncbi:hypothetical protein BDB01DRAFT_777201 [Pilobolus umbonatus]|nr:hypothetical protein BDB01DRAFT_777201 [Pilobolus umbonatus]
MNSLYPEPHYWRPCDENGVCHCDFRFQIFDCVESEPLRQLYLATGITSGVLTVVIIIILYIRLNYRNQTIFEIRDGFPRPKPIESMAVLGAVFNLLQAVNAAIILTDSIPNPIFRSFMYDFPFQFGYCCLACYFFGVAYALADSSRLISAKWVTSHSFFNILCVITMTAPFVTNNIFSIVGGYYASVGKNGKATQSSICQYVHWTLYCAFMACSLLFAGYRLVRLLSKHMQTRTDLRFNVSSIKTGIIKVKVIIGVGCACMTSYCILLGFYSAWRDWILAHTLINTIVSVLWLCSGTMATIVVVIAVIISPKVVLQMSNIFFTLDNKSSENNLTKKNSITGFSTNTRRPSKIASTINPAPPTIPLPNAALESQFSMEELIRDSMDSYNFTSEASSSKIEEDQIKYNATINRVRTPPLYHLMKYPNRVSDTFK